ncbi:MAG: VanZ family protein [Acidobacteriota bacterium]|nr:VanZ family protein [Acidobacteriota bacterium]
MRIWIYRWGPAVLIMSIIFIASATPGSKMPEFGYWDLGVKKGGHMIGYALLGAAFCHALHGTRRAAKHFFIWAFVLTVLYAMSDEVHQTFTAGRTPAILDVGIDAIGGCMGIAAARWLRRRFPAEKTA